MCLLQCFSSSINGLLFQFKLFTVGGVTSAHHGWVNRGIGGSASVGGVAVSIRDNGDVNTFKDIGDAATRLEINKYYE